jgi:hypothetical protein
LLFTLGEKFREVLTTTFGLEDWFFCWKKPLPMNLRNGESMGLLPLHRSGSEFVTQVLTTSTTISGSLATGGIPTPITLMGPNHVKSTTSTLTATTTTMAELDEEEEEDAILKLANDTNTHQYV